MLWMVVTLSLGTMTLLFMLPTWMAWWGIGVVGGWGRRWGIMSMSWWRLFMMLLMFLLLLLFMLLSQWSFKFFWLLGSFELIHWILGFLFCEKLQFGFFFEQLLPIIIVWGSTTHVQYTTLIHIGFNKIATLICEMSWKTTSLTCRSNDLICWDMAQPGHYIFKWGAHIDLVVVGTQFEFNR